MAAVNDNMWDKVTRGSGIGQPTHSIFGFKLLEKDPVVELAKALGYRVAEYDLPPYPLQTAGIIAVRMMGFMGATGVLAWVLYHYVANRSRFLNYSCMAVVASVLLLWPEVVGRSGVMLLDFWRPALGFRSALLAWDIFHIRTREEVNSWNPARFFCHLWAFPMEEEEIAERTKREGFERDPRIQNMKGLPKVILEGGVLLLTLYFIPPAELTVGMSRVAYHAYCDTLGLSILMALALFGDGLLKSLGVLFGVEMSDMFENPLGTTNIRLFWSHWNRAIASVLHRVIFAGGSAGKKAPSSSSKKTTVQKKGDRLEQVRARQHLDHLSETEHEGGKTDEEDEHHQNGNGANGTSSSVSKSKKLKPMTPVPSKEISSEKSKQSSQQQQAEKSKKKGPFYPKAIAAIFTFAMSGVFHEHITRNTLGFANGENFIFFLLNGFATVASTWFKRTFPEANAKIPTFVSVILLHLFFYTIVPLFCSPFIRSGFFTQMDALKYELLPIAPRPRGTFIYLFGN
ncbi:unnamed protein product [Sympodiomycopsis kandeliae]